MASVNYWSQQSEKPTPVIHIPIQTVTVPPAKQPAPPPPKPTNVVGQRVPTGKGPRKPD